MISLPKSDTICAIATPSGEGGLGVIRVSGSSAVAIVAKLFLSKKEISLVSVPSRRALFGRLIDPQTGKLLDEVICTVMRAPHSYTGEDVVELSAHGNPHILSRILESLIRSGARLAERGEFTKRAFLNGKLDLTQAEGVMDAVSAKTVGGIESALDQLDGKLGRYLKGLRQAVLAILSPIEACIDFPEEEVPEVSRAELQLQVGEVVEKIDEVLKGANAGRLLREGFSSVIVGKPNVGKSSLLNALLRENRAIVTDIPGTTRDTIEEWSDVQGIPMRFIDTAGIRGTVDAIEQIGISRSKEALAKGDLMLLVIDRSVPLEAHDFELLNIAREKKSVVVLNKMDLEGPVGVTEVQAHYSGPLVPLSILKEDGLESLEKQILATVLDHNETKQDTPLVTRMRHQEGLERAKQFLTEAGKTLEARLPLDLAAGDLRGAADTIGRITGENYTEDLLAKIFAEFCIGK